MTNITTIGIDLAKEVFAVCAMDITRAVVYYKGLLIGVCPLLLLLLLHRLRIK